MTFLCSHFGYKITDIEHRLETANTELAVNEVFYRWREGSENATVEELKKKITEREPSQFIYESTMEAVEKCLECKYILTVDCYFK